MTLGRFPWQRLLLSILTAAVLAVLSELLLAQSLPSLAETSSLMIGFVLYIAIYAFFILSVWGLSLVIAQFGVSQMLVYFVLYVAISSAYGYFTQIGFEFYQLGGRVLVANHVLTSAGWSEYLKSSTATTVIALVTATILFRPTAQTLAHPTI